MITVPPSPLQNIDTAGFGMQRIVVWGMKCISYDYDFESNLATEWKALDRPAPQPKRRWQGRRLLTTDDSEYEDEAPTSRSRDRLSRKARCKRSAQKVSESVAVFSSEGSSDEDAEDLYGYVDADVGDFSDD